MAGSMLLAAHRLPRWLLDRLVSLPADELHLEAKIDHDLIKAGLCHPLQRKRLLLEFQRLRLLDSQSQPTSAGEPQALAYKRCTAHRPLSAPAGRTRIKSSDDTNAVAIGMIPRRRPQSAPFSGFSGQSQGAPLDRRQSVFSAKGSRTSRNSRTSPGDGCGWRWPFTGVSECTSSECGPPLSPSPKKSAYADVRRCFQKTQDAKLKASFIPTAKLGVSKFVEPRKVLKIASEPEGNAGAASGDASEGDGRPNVVLVDCLFEQNLIEHADGAAEVETYLDWDGWLANRLTPNGPLALIDVLEAATKGGNLDQLRSVVQEARSHGPDFLQCLERLPHRNTLPSSRLACNKPRLWSRANERVEELSACESELILVVRDAIEAIQNANVLISMRDQEQICEAGHELLSDDDEHDDKHVSRRTTLCLSSTRFARMSRASHISMGVLHEGGDGEPIRTSCGTRLWRKASNAVFTRVRIGLAGAADTLLHIVRQENLEGVVRDAADKTLQELKEAELDLFARFVLWCAPVDVELQLVAELDVDAERLEEAIMTARRHMGARSLIGVSALAIAEKFCVGVIPPNEEPYDPWPAVEVNPPWEVSYLNAVDKLVRMQRCLLHHTLGGANMQTLGDPEQPHLDDGQKCPHFDKIQGSLTLMTEGVGSCQMSRDAAAHRTSVRQDLLERAHARHSSGQQRSKALSSRLESNNCAN